MTSTHKSWEPEDFCHRASELIHGDRAEEYGDYIELHMKVAELWNAWLKIRRHSSRDLSARDVLIMMSLLKVARRECGVPKKDSTVDGIGYLALSGPLDIAE